MAERTAEILCIGTELLLGDVVNTNAAFIARCLTSLGICVYHQSVVGDNPQRLRDSLSLAFSRADIVITTGGLGPTYDDLSKETIAKFFGLPLVEHEASVRHIREFFERLHRPMTPNNLKQALMPKGCTVFANQNGTAPGCAIEQDGKTAILLPGPPREMGPMMEQSVVPYLQRGSEFSLVSKNLYFFGIGEAALEEKLRDLMQSSENPTIAPYAKTGEVMIRVTARVKAGEQAQPLLEPAVAKIKAAVGEFLYGEDVGDLQTAVVRCLKGKGLRLAAAESCTGGMAAQRLTSVSGASEVLECAVCTYSNRMKHELLGVRQETLERCGAVSAETAQEMAQGVLRLSGADIAVAVTGNAGPTASEGKEVGLVYVSVASGWHNETLTLHLERRDDDAREYIRVLASSHALMLALRTAQGWTGKAE